MNKKLLPAALLLTSVSSFSSGSDNTGFYLGGIIGQSSIDENSTQYNYGENGFSAGVVLGYHISDNFGIDGMIYHTSYDSLVSNIVSASPKYTFRVSDNVSLYAKAGLAYAIAFSGETKDSEWCCWDTISGLGPVVGIGANFAVSQKTNLRLSYDYHNINMEDSDNEIADTKFKLDTFGLALYHQF